MNLSDLAIKRPVFITCVASLILILGYLSMGRLPVDNFPKVDFPIVMVNTPYPGAGPVEVETLVSKVFEDEMSTLPGIKNLRSINKEGISTVVAEFTLETDIKYAEQQVRDRVGSARRKLPEDIKEPTVRRIDPADQPILIVSVKADLPQAELYDLADEVIRPKIEQVAQVGLVEVIGGRKREIQVELNREKLRQYELSATAVSTRLAAAGQNIPAGKVDEAKNQTVFRTLGEFGSIKDIQTTIVNFLGNDIPVTIADVGAVKDGLADEKSRAYANGDPALFLMVYRQSGANTIAVADGVKARVEKLNAQYKTTKGAPSLSVVRDSSKMIRANVTDVEESILIGIVLTIVVVFFFLGNVRSTFITGLALPNSLLGAFFIMAIAGFTINIMSLLALSLAVGLLIDDAIVVRENIFRHMEMGKSPADAARDGSKEVTLAVLATTLAVLAVFGPIGFLSGVVGQFFKEFGLTICFAMAISLFDALTMAPMLSAYLAGHSESKGILGSLTKGFDRFQNWLEDVYVSVLKITLDRPLLTIMASVLIFFSSLFAAKAVPKTFLPPQDMGEFSVSLELPPGTNLETMNTVTLKADKAIRDNPEVVTSIVFLGNSDGEANTATFFVQLVDSHHRKVNTSQMKEKIREQLKPLAYANPIVKDIDMVGGGQRPFNVNIIGQDLPQIEEVANGLFKMLAKHPGIKDAEISNKPGKPEFQVKVDNRRAERLGVSTLIAGAELRNWIEGSTPTVYRENGREYDIRVRLQENQRDLKTGFDTAFVPNINQRLVRLRDIADPIQTTGPATINRQDRGRYIQIGADIAPSGPGMGGVMADIKTYFEKEHPLPAGVRYGFEGQAENFQELGKSMVMAAGLGILFIFMVLASLYESIVTPFTIMLVLPLAACGAFIALYVTGSSLDLFSMIGCIMLLGIATKNSILLVDYTHQLVTGGMSHRDALLRAGKVRLRPILMTTIALIAGMLPIAIGLNEASKQRTSMGIAVIGGLISSTILTLVVVPAAYSYIERFRVWSLGFISRLVMSKPHPEPKEPTA